MASSAITTGSLVPNRQSSSLLMLPERAAHIGSEKRAVFRVVDEDGGVADGNIVCPGEVDGELIHTDAPDDGKKMSADLHHGLPGEIPREAVSVANRQDGDAAVPLSRKVRL